MSGPYDDIIELPHPTSTKHSRMPISDRASIFSPFAALTGHGDAIQETARLTDRRIELDEDTKAMLDLKQQILADRIAEHPEISVVWFRADKKKDGGHRPFACFLSLVSARRRRRGGECHSCLLGRHSMRPVTGRS